MSITFDDVLIVPQYSEVTSRRNVSTKTNLNRYNQTSIDIEFDLPVISANMKTITGPKMANKIAQHGGWAVLHRFNSIDDAVNEFLASPKSTGVSIGVKEKEDLERADALYQAGARIFCIDVAHGHHISMKNMIETLVRRYKDIFIIAGNIATSSGLVDLASWGADCVKVGIGPGSVCTTRRNAGVGVPQLTALENVWSINETLHRPVSIIADGGCKTPGDIAKALKYSDAVMIGGMFKGTKETPGRVFRNIENMYYKGYGGSASGENKGSNDFIEGVFQEVPFMGGVKFILREIDHGIRSAFSYSASTTLEEFQKNCILMPLSHGSRIESKL